MTAVDEVLGVQALIQNGRYVIPHPETGKPTRNTRATNFAKILSDSFNLERYGKRMVALGLAERHDLLVSVAACTPDQKRDLDDLCYRASEAARGDYGSNWGTAAHNFTERIDRGEQNIVIPPPLNADDPDMAADLAAYRATVTAAGLRMLDFEQVVLLAKLGVAGKFDRIAEAPDLLPEPFIADLKTGGYLDYLAIAMQLALYSRAETIYDPDTRTHRPMPAVSQRWAMVIHLPRGEATCTLYWVDLNVGWAAVEIAAEVRDLRKIKGLFSVVKVATAGGDTAASSTRPDSGSTPQVPAVASPAGPDVLAWVRDRVVNLIGAGHGDKIAATWPADTPTLKEGGHTAAQLDAIEAAVSTVEVAVDFPWPGVRPGSEPEPVAADPFDGLPSPTNPTVAPTIPASDPRIVAIIERGERLPVDLLASLDAATVGNNRTPNIRSGKATAENLAHVERELVRCELAHGKRDGAIRSLLDGLDEDMAATLLDGRAVDAFTADEVTALEQLVTAVDRCIVGFTYQDTQPVLLSLEKAEQVLVDGYGTKTRTLTAAKATAAELGRANPRTFAQVLADPPLVAALTFDIPEPTTPAKESPL